MVIIFKKQNVCKSLLFIIVMMNEAYNIVTGYLHLTRVKSTNSKKYSKGKIQR